MRYSSVLVTALIVCENPVQRPLRSQATSGRTVALQCLSNIQCIGNCADIHSARGFPAVATFSPETWYSKATVAGSRFHSKMLSDRKRQNWSEVSDWCGPQSTVCFALTR